MGTRQHKTKGWVIFAVFCAVLFCVAALRACAAKAAPEGCSLKRVRPAQTAWFPLGTTAWRVSDAYGWRTDPITGEEAFHRGTDLACSEGTLVLAAMNGVVTAARRSATYGNYLCLSHSGGQETLYAHLQYLFVRAGEVVQAGQPLGTAGETGRSTGAHLHFELLEQGVRYDAGGSAGPAMRRLVRLGPLVFRDPLLLCGALYLLLWFDASGFLRIGLCAAILHEIGHIFVYLLLFRRFPVIEVTMTGFCMRTRGQTLTRGQTFLLAAAGPGMNGLLAAIWAMRMEQCATIRGSAFLAANLLTGAFNLLPIPPLDGAQMLRCLLQSSPK